MRKPITEDPFASVRRPVPAKAGKPIRHRKEYIKPLEKEKMRDEIEKGILDYVKEDDDHAPDNL